MRTGAALLLALTLLAAMGCKERPASPLSSHHAHHKSGTLRFFDVTNVDVREVPLLMALDDLAAQGYTIEKTKMTSSALIADALGRGQADIGLLNNQTMWAAIAQGTPVRTIAEFTAPTTVLAAKTEIRSCHDLDGKRLAVATTSGLNPALLDRYLEQNCPEAHPRLLVIPQSAGRAAALLTGEIDAEIVPGEELLKLQIKAPQKFHAIMSYAREFPAVRVDGLHARRQWAERNPEAVKDFLRALLLAQRRITANPPMLYAESVKRLSLDPGAAKAVGEADLRMAIWDPNGGFSWQSVRDTIGFLNGIGALPPGLKPEDVADLSYLNAVLDEIGRR